MSIANGKRKRDDGAHLILNLAEPANQSSAQESFKENEQLDFANRQAKRPKQANGAGNLRHNTLLTGLYTEEVYKSSLFKLQVDELLDQIRPDLQPVAAKLGDILRSLKGIIESIPSHDALSIPEAEKKFQAAKIHIPFPESRPALDANYRVRYQRPSNMEVVGSYDLHTMKLAKVNTLDFVVTMPSDLFQEKDYMNYRYLLKRAFYLACIAEAINSQGYEIFCVKYDTLQENELLPILVLRPKQNQATLKDWRINVIPAVNQGLFKKEKLYPSRNCVRSSTCTPDNPDRHATTFYNSSLQSDSLFSSYSKLLHETLASCTSFQDACLLGRTWLQQRGFSGAIGNGGFGSFEWNSIMALLLRGRGTNDSPLFSGGYSSYQFFKAMLQFLASQDLMKTPTVIGGKIDLILPKVIGFPFLFDGDRGHNTLYKMSAWSLKLLQHEARISLVAFSEPSFDQFYPIFIAKIDYELCRFDAFLEINEEKLYATLQSKNYESDCHGRLQLVHKFLVKALNNRVDVISIKRPEQTSWDLKDKKPTNSSERPISIGFIFNEAHINRTVDRGPKAEQTREVATFRAFWGDKAELRRFKDGSILESVIWHAGEVSVFRQILNHVLSNHFGGLDESSYRVTETSLANIIPLKTSQGQTDVEAFQNATAALSALREKIREIDDMPLHLRQLLPASGQLSSTSVDLPFSGPLGPGSTPVDCTIQFEGSTRWPDDIDAIQRTKIAFLLKLAELLETGESIIACRVGLENEESPLQNQGFLDVVSAAGSAFRFRIHHDREAILLDRALKSKNQTSQDKQSLAAALHSYKKTFIAKTAHVRAMQALAIKYPSFSQSVRLVKHWFDSHLLSHYFDESLIELFVAEVYIRPYPWSAPRSPTCGLLRTLHQLSRWDWIKEPWITNLGSDPMTEPDVAAINTRFQAWRKIDPAMNRVILFAASSVDHEGTTWTDYSQPPKVVAGRMTSLARLSLQIMKDKGTQFDVREILTSSLADYDFLINIDRTVADCLSYRPAKDRLKFKNLQLQATTSVENIGYDPVRAFFKEIQRIFQDSITFFYNQRARNVISGLWNPNLKRTWKLKLGYSSIPGPDGQVDLNKGAVLHEIRRIGGNLVTSVTSKEVL